jgi:hypothetical protein
MAQQMRWSDPTCVSYVQEQVLPHFWRAAAADPTDAQARVHLAIWTGELYAKRPSLSDDAYKALKWAKEAKDLDPEGPTGYETRYSLYVEFAKLARSQAERAAGLEQKKFFQSRAQERWHRAAESLRPYLAYAPTDAFVHFQIAEALYRGEEWAGLVQEGEETLRLNEVSHRPRKLPDKKRKTLQDWMAVAQHYLALEPRPAGR